MSISPLTTIQQALASHKAKPTKGICILRIVPHVIKLLGKNRAQRQLGKVLGKILRQLGIRNERLNGRRKLPCFERLPVNLAEKAVVLQRLEVLGHIASEAFLGLLAQEAGEKVLGVGTKVVRERELRLDNLLLDFGVVVAWKRGCAGEEIDTEST